MWLHFGTVLAQKVCRSQGRATASEATLWRPRQERRKTVWEEQPGFPHAVGHCSAAPKPSPLSPLGPCTLLSAALNTPPLVQAATPNTWLQET